VLMCGWPLLSRAVPMPYARLVVACTVPCACRCRGNGHESAATAGVRRLGRDVCGSGRMGHSGGRGSFGDNRAISRFVGRAHWDPGAVPHPLPERGRYVYRSSLGTPRGRWQGRVQPWTCCGRRGQVRDEPGWSWRTDAVRRCDVDPVWDRSAIRPLPANAGHCGRGATAMRARCRSQRIPRGQLI